VQGGLRSGGSAPLVADSGAEGTRANGSSCLCRRVSRAVRRNRVVGRPGRLLRRDRVVAIGLVRAILSRGRMRS
jgi:hypothetical protein